MEQEEYTKEEIIWSYVEFVDNQDVLDLIEKVLTHNDHTMSTYNILLLLHLVLEHYHESSHAETWRDNCSS